MMRLVEGEAIMAFMHGGFHGSKVNWGKIALPPSLLAHELAEMTRRRHPRWSLRAGLAALATRLHARLVSRPGETR